MSEIMDTLITVSFHYGEVNNNKPKLNQWGICSFRLCLFGCNFWHELIRQCLTHIGCHTPSEKACKSGGVEKLTWLSLHWPLATLGDKNVKINVDVDDSDNHLLWSFKAIKNSKLSFILDKIQQKYLGNLYY